jgi:starch phosphorylase
MAFNNPDIKARSVSSPECSVQSLKNSIAYKLMFNIGVDPGMAKEHDWMNATLLAVRDRLIERWLKTNRAQYSQDIKQVYYLSMEFLQGRALSNALLAVGLFDVVKQALDEMGLNLDLLLIEENDPGLGNGGLGRLAACFLDSLATMGYPSRGYGIRYEYGMFKQTIVDGQQAESPDNWSEDGHPWEISSNSINHKVLFGGRVQQEGKKSCWIETEEVIARPYDQIVPGYDTPVANTLRLWCARASSEINLGKFNQGDYFAAVEDKNHSENVSRVLYPDDSTSPGYELRLRQEYFLVSATLQDIIRRHLFMHNTLDNFPDKAAIHLNDTHPVLAIPELMRLLIDEYDYEWQNAWDIVIQIFSYTNHTLLSEALETWPVELMGKLLPRHLQIIFEINENFLESIQSFAKDDPDLIRRVSIIDETNGRKVRMAWLAVIGSHKINGVSKLHSQLMIESLFADFAHIFPQRFCNKTNGVTPRRWLALANRPLTKVLDQAIGHNWRTNLEQLKEIEPLMDYPSFVQAIREAKFHNKILFSIYAGKYLNTVIDPHSLFDVQIKRIHEYKRQLLNVLHVITRYNRIIDKPDKDWVPRVIIFSGKAASAYKTAKQIIHLINDVANTINNDQRVNGKLKVVFVPNYGVSLAQLMIPAADLSEQISLAGMEASGTSNMKFALNGALTIGTLDGANIEIGEKVGFENMFIFGNNAEQVKQLREEGYAPHQIYDNDHELRQVLNQIATGVFNPSDPNRYHNLFDMLVNLGDHYQLLADYRSYVDTQTKVDDLYRQPDQWTRKTILNIANMGYFSSDRTIREYAEEIWHIKPLKL